MNRVVLREADQESGTISFEAVSGIQAGREFYNAMCSFATIYNHFKFNEDPQIPPKLRAQRKLRESRIPEITNYITKNPDSYIFSSITVSVGGKITFYPAPGQGEGRSGRLGRVIIPIDAPILINDGQHRCAAIKAAYEQKPELRNEKISVVIFEDRGLKHSQQMFTDLNKNAVKPTKSLSLLYDHRDTFARFVVKLADDVDIFSGRTEMEKNSISGRSTKFFTLNGISDATRQLLRLRTKSISPERQKLAIEYWNTVARNIPEWNLLVQRKVTPYELRQEYAHSHTNILNALGMVGYVLVQMYSNSWKNKMAGLRRIRWEKDNPVWEGKVMIDGRMIKTKRGIKKAANEILQQCGVKETVEGTE